MSVIRVGFRAGILGAIGAFVIEFLVLVPLAGQCLVWIFSLGLWVAVGALVAYWRLPRARDTDLVVGGAIAGLITGLIGGLLGILLVPILLLLVGGTSGLLHTLPPDMASLYREAGIAPEVLFSPTGLFLVMTLSCIFQLIGAAIVSALSAVLLSSWLSTEEEVWEEEQGPYMLEW